MVDGRCQTCIREEEVTVPSITFHGLRHSCASLLFAQGCPLRLVMEILGHSQIALTANTHTHLLPEADREVATAMESLLGGSLQLSSPSTRVTSWLRFLCYSHFGPDAFRMDIVHTNPCDKLEQPRTSTPPARGLSAEEVRRLLAIIPATPKGLRDHAIILTLVLTGRRRAEVSRMTAGDLSFEEGICFYSYRGERRQGRPTGVPAARPGRPESRTVGLREGPGGDVTPASHCGPLRPPPKAVALPAARSMDASVATSRTLVFLLRGFTSFVIPPLNSAGTLEKASKMYPGSWITAHRPSQRPTCDIWRAKRTGAGGRWPKRLASR